MDVSLGNMSMSSTNDDSMSSMTKQSSNRKIGPIAAVTVKTEVNQKDRNSFYNDLYQFHDNKGFVLFTSYKYIIIDHFVF